MPRSEAQELLEVVFDSTSGMQGLRQKQIMVHVANALKELHPDLVISGEEFDEICMSLQSCMNYNVPLITILFYYIKETHNWLKLRDVSF